MDDDEACDAPGVLLRQGRGFTMLPPFLAEGLWPSASRLCHLSLASNALTSLDALRSLPHLQVLDVSRNKLESLDGIGQLKNLRVLLAQGNAVGKRERATEQLQELAFLEELWLGENRIEAPSELLCLENVSALRVLELAPNPLCHAPELGEYRSFVIGLFPRLRWCDGQAVSGEDRSGADAFAASKAGEVARHRLRADAAHRELHARKTANLVTPQQTMQATPSSSSRLRQSGGSDGASLPSPSPPPSVVAVRPPHARFEPSLARSVEDANEISLADLARPDPIEKPRRKRRPKKREEPPPLPVIPPDATRTPWPPAPAIFPPYEASYKTGKTVAVAALANGSVHCRWPRGGVAISSDANCLRCFYESGQLAVVADARGAISVTRRDGRTILALHASGGGFRGDDKGSCAEAWASAQDAPPQALYLELRSDAKKKASLAVVVDARAHFATAFFCHKNMRVACPQHGGVRQLAQGTDVFGRARQPPSSRKKALPADLPPGSPAASHADLLARIRDSMKGLEGLTAGLD